jgi:hypothetical protein
VSARHQCHRASTFVPHHDLARTALGTLVVDLPRHTTPAAAPCTHVIPTGAGHDERWHGRRSAVEGPRRAHHPMSSRPKRRRADRGILERSAVEGSCRAHASPTLLSSFLTSPSLAHIPRSRAFSLGRRHPLPPWITTDFLQDHHHLRRKSRRKTSPPFRAFRHFPYFCISAGSVAAISDSFRHHPECIPARGPLASR